MNSSVLMFCPQFRPMIGGAECHAENLAAALAETGCRVTILTPRKDSDSPGREEANGVIIERFLFTDLSCRYPVAGVAVLNIPYILWQIARAVWPYLKGADVLHCHIGSLETAAAALASRWAGVPNLCTAATADQRSDLGEIEKTGATGPLVAWLARTSIQTWVGTTAAVETALIRAGVERGKIVCIPNGVTLSDELNTESRAAGMRHFLYLGRLSTTANRDVPALIRAFNHLTTTHPDLELAIVGAGDLFEQTKRLVETSSARNRIHMPGFDEPEKWLAWADCFVLPSRKEGLSVALLEAMAVGLPCIANDIPSNREVLDDGKAGVLVPVENCDALQKAMENIVEDEAMARRLGRTARERAEQCYSMNSVAARYMILYESLLAS